MEKRKGSLSQRIFVVLLAAVLITGMVSNTAPASVLAQEGNGTGSVSGNDVELTEEETKPEEEGTEQETVSENIAADEENWELQALLERIAVLPDTEEYLAAEPDADSGEADEEAYEQWMSGLYAYVQEALAIQEAVEELSEEEQAEIPEEALAKLAAWAEIAEQAAESSMVMTADAEGTFGTDSKLHWKFDSASGTLTISGDGEMGQLLDFRDWDRYKESVRKVEIDSGVTDIGRNAFYGWKNLAEVSIPDTVWLIREGAFSRCSSLSNVTIPNSVTGIMSSAFANSGLTDITIPGSVQMVPNDMFYGCSSLASVKIEDGVKLIGEEAFMLCRNLTAVTIPGSVKKIDAKAFRFCSSLRDVTFEGTDTIPILTGEVFYGCPCVKDDTKGLHIPSHQYLQEYSDAVGWDKYKRNIDAPHILSYNASGAVITQRCSISGCDLFATAELSTDNAEYACTGNEIKPAKITYSSDWIGEKPEDADIVYLNNTNPGEATAKLTIGGATAELTFTIVALPYAVTVQNGEGSGNYKTGDSVTITADAPASGMQFDKWVINGGSVTLADSTNSTTTFIMPAEAVSVMATYKNNTRGDGGNNGGGNHNDGSDNRGANTLDKVPTTVIATPPEELENAVLTETEKQQKADEASTVIYQKTTARPKTGDNTLLELYVTLAMISGFAYLLLYFTDRERGMTEETKRELVSRLIGWAKQGGKLKKCLALAVVFVLLVYYHSIGKKMRAESSALPMSPM